MIGGTERGLRGARLCLCRKGLIGFRSDCTELLKRGSMNPLCGIAFQTEPKLWDASWFGRS